MLSIYIYYLVYLSTITNAKNCISDEYMHCGGEDHLNCISKEWWCDGHVDCDSGNDESNCPKQNCLENEFQCHSGTQCIPKLLQCDGSQHCLDKSDELYCKKSEKKVCHPIQEFDCNRDGEKCISISKMCDGKNDCGRNQDEQPGGSSMNCQRNDCRLKENGGCSHFCTNLFTHIKCHCPPGYRLLGNQMTCADIDECSQEPKPCSQICNNSPGSYNCRCHSGFKLDPHNPGQCIAEGSDRVLLISLEKDSFLTINLSNKSFQSHFINEPRATWPHIDVDLNSLNQTIFWSSESTRELGKVQINIHAQGDRHIFTRLIKISRGRNESFCTDLSFDWLRKLLFWTSENDQKIYVTNTTSGVTAQLLSKDVHNPRSIAVDPFSTQIYWIDWKNNKDSAKIETMLMNTNNRRVLVSKNLRQPTDLTIDLYDHRLYWSDINPGSISYIDLRKPSSPEILISNKLLHPFSIVVFENKIYWSDWRQNQIISVEKNIGINFTILANVKKPYDILVLHRLNQPQLNSSQSRFHSCLSTETHMCSHLCLPSPPKNLDGSSVTPSLCLCPVDLVLNDDQHSCYNSLTSVRLSNSNRYQIIFGVALSLILIFCLSFSIICIYLCRQRSWTNSNKCNNRKFFQHPIVTGDLMFIFKCSSHSSQLSELLPADCSSTSIA